MDDAIKREKQLKASSREKKIDLISQFNPVWKELSACIIQGRIFIKSIKCKMLRNYFIFYKPSIDTESKKINFNRFESYN